MCGLLIKNLNAHNLQLHRQHCGQFKNVNKTSTISNFFKKLTNSASKKSSTKRSQVKMTKYRVYFLGVAKYLSEIKCEVKSVPMF